ncbi:hypothetical protein C2G38_2159633 [Gigaspora rosea]|uniref:Uncharacterized protein n=1 Tax=Gigaspora rosea TaxID=44941 RepID=A0A397W0R0_9GLOM|nr:hypothetical protein C2G38_2159633 [Gigaspora rosea]
MDNKDSLKSFEKQLLNIIALFELNDQNLADKDGFEYFEEQSLNIIALFEQNLVESDNQNLAESNDQNLAKMVDTMVGQIFGSWKALNCYITLYTRSQNFVNVIHGSEYDNSACQSHRYACEYQDYNVTKKKTCIAENQ